MRNRAAAWILGVMALVACDAAEDVRVLPLPSLESASPEARAGLPVVSGVWQFAGWELAPGDTGRAEGDLPGLGQLRLETQRLDSIAGFYLAGEGRLPLVGEVRRDSVLSLAGGGRFLAGRVGSDTLWLSLTSLVEPGSWPDDARAAFVRSDVGSRFVRVKGQRPVLAAADSVPLDTTRIAAASADTAPPPVVRRRGLPLTPGRTMPPRMAESAPPAPSRAPQRAEPEQPAPSRAERQAEPQQEPPRQQEPTPQQVEPEPEPEPEPTPTPRRRRPRLLGEPIDSIYSPTAARAISRPGEVSASR